MNNYVFGRRSMAHLASLHPDLRRVLEIALSQSPFDFTVVCGHRGEGAQNEAYSVGTSKKRWPDSRHNLHPSGAVDVAPWINGTISWSDEGSFYVLAGVVLSAAAEIGVAVRYGGDWNRNGLTEDQSFQDLGHFELV